MTRLLPLTLICLLALAGSAAAQWCGPSYSFVGGGYSAAPVYHPPVYSYGPSYGFGHAHFHSHRGFGFSHFRVSPGFHHGGRFGGQGFRAHRHRSYWY